MRFPWRRRALPRAEVEQSQRALTQAQRQEEHVAQVIEKAQAAVERNHFGERFHKAMEGRS